MRCIEKWAKPVYALTKDDIVIFDVTKGKPPDEYFLKETCERYQEAYNKNSVVIYSDYNTDNGPVDGFTLLCETEFYNLFIKENNI